MAAGYGEGRAAAPAEELETDGGSGGESPRFSLAGAAGSKSSRPCWDACGVPADLVRPGPGGRESYRRWVAGSVAPLARLVADEFGRALDVPGLRLRFGALGAADVTGRARAWRSLVGNEGGDAGRGRAPALVGLD